jgi:mannose-6-phosphate isomerase
MSGAATSCPHRLGPNKVPVYYSGGAGIDRFRGEPGAAGPEDWVGSVTPFPANLLPAGADRSIGVSRLGDGGLLDVAVRADPVGWLGPSLAGLYETEPGLLVKLLDAGERLPVHCHPTRAFAQAHLGSRFGKNEGWIVIAAEPEARIWLGFVREATIGELRHWVDTQDAAAMLAVLNKLEVVAGDVFYVPAGLPHAIGPGVTIVELQEPTSFSILAEHDPFGVNAHDATLGLGWEVALSCFDLSATTGAKLQSLRPAMHTVASVSGGTVSRLFGEEAEPYFQAYRARSVSSLPLGPAEFRVLVVEQGEGRIAFAGGAVGVKAGETWVVPHGAGQLDAEGALELIVCCPPVSPS